MTLRRRLTVGLTLFVLASTARVEPAQRAAAREPASRAAVVLTWNQAQREAGFAAMESIFLTRTVRAAAKPRPLPTGRALAAYATGGARAAEVDQFIKDQKVAGVLVLHDGTLRLERYALTGGIDTRWHSFSVAKSITSTLVGAAMKDGHIKSLDDPVTRYIAGLRGSAYDDVTVKQLLTMTSGVRWNEDYTDLTSDVARMYATPPDPGFDMTVSYVRKLPREAPPGTKWVYKTSETNLVGVLVAEAVGKPLADYLSEKIWRPYGMERDAEWMVDDVGHEQGGCCLAMTLRDLGRFGQFILDGARIGGQAVVPDSWLAEATRNQIGTIGAGSGYGYQWWPRDDGTFEGRGIYGQTLHIDPKRRLVIAINSAAEAPTGRGIGQTRQAFIAAVKAEIDAEKTRTSETLASRFTAHTIGTGLTGGYQVVIADLNGDRKPDILALASGLKELRWYENPGWQPHVLVSGINQPINAAAADVDGDGIPEIALAHDFSNVYARSAGTVSILTHQGDPAGPWSIREIDRVPTSHRLRFVDIDGSGRNVLVNFPLIGAQAVAPDYRARVPLLMYRPGAWKRELITDADEGVVHGIHATNWSGDRREALLSASFRGIHVLQFERGRWIRTLITKGDPDPWPKSGSSDVVVGRLGSERFVATIEPWHGNKVVVYRQDNTSWKRHVIDDSIADGHTIVAGDFDRDGLDEIIVGERQGKRSAYLYRVSSQKDDTWIKEVLDDGGMAAAGCAVADLNADASPDVVCIGTATANLKWYENRQKDHRSPTRNVSGG